MLMTYAALILRYIIKVISFSKDFINFSYKKLPLIIF